jgi:ornithine cyclodeaminase/alanine dehydrogenase-like protein (mu-crystallin family)
MAAHSNERSILLLRPDDVNDLITIKEAIDLVEQGYGEANDFPLINAPRRRVHTRNNIRVSCFPGGVDGLGVIGALVRGETVAQDASTSMQPYCEHPVYVLWDSATAHLNAIIIGQLIEKRVGHSERMALRTAATSGVGFRYLARKNSTVAGLFGTGEQAIHKVLALQNERAIKTYKVYSRNAANRERFCALLSTLIDAEMVPTESPRDVVAGSDVVICATNSNVPVFDGNWLEPGQHIVSVVGSNSGLVKGGWLDKGRRENDDRTVERASFVVTNMRESVESEQQAGLMEPLQKGALSWDKVHELGDIINGKVPGRTSDEQITYHANNNGTAAADLAIAQWIYERCKSLGRGMSIGIPLGLDATKETVRQ